MNDLAAEAKRLNKELARLTYKGSYVAEIPMRLHEPGTDAGHGLGGPPLHPKLIAYLRDAGVCFCDETWPDGKPRPHACDRRFENAPARFRPSMKQTHPRRLKRALRQLRLIAPLEFDPVYLMLARGRSWTEAMTDINERLVAAQRPPYTETDFTLLCIAGFDKLTACW